MKAVYILQKNNRNVYDSLIADDVVGRQTVILKDASTYVQSLDGYLIYYEGSAEAAKRMEDVSNGLVKRLDPRLEKEVLDKIREEDDKAEGGMGFLFG